MYIEGNKISHAYILCNIQNIVCDAYSISLLFITDFMNIISFNPISMLNKTELRYSLSLGICAQLSFSKYGVYSRKQCRSLILLMDSQIHLLFSKQNMHQVYQLTHATTFAHISA